MSFTIAEGDRRSELSSLIRAGLGHPVEGGTFEALVAMQSRLQERQQELGGQLIAGKISREKYLSSLDDALRAAAQEGERLLGVDDFHKVFGEFRAHNMIDVSVFSNSARFESR